MTGVRQAAKTRRCPRRTMSSLRAATAALALLVPFAPLTAARADETPDIQATLFCYPDGKDRLAITYSNKKPSKDEILQDFSELARAVGAAGPRVTIHPAEGPGGLVTPEAELSGLANGSNGQVNVDAFLNAFREYKHVQVWVLFSNPVAIPPDGERSTPPLRVRTRGSGQGVIYDIWIDQSQGTPTGTLSVQKPKDTSSFVWLAAGATLLVVGISALLIWFVVNGQQRRPGVTRPSPAREGK